jgi:hypothetical protein
MLTRTHLAASRLLGGTATNSSAWATRQRAWRGKEQAAGQAAGLAESKLTLLRAEYARLVAAARASMVAARAGAADPLVYVEAELARHGGLPPKDATVPAILADAAAAMALAGRAARLHESAETAGLGSLQLSKGRRHAFRARRTPRRAVSSHWERSGSSVPIC